jgi:hypothetical protein
MKTLSGKRSYGWRGIIVVIALTTPHSLLPTPLSADSGPERKVSLNAESFFAPNYRVSDGEKRLHWAHTFSSGARSLAVSGKEVYAVWYDVRKGDSDVFFAKSADRGLSFGRNIRVNDDRGKAKQYKPTLGVDRAGTIYSIWRDDRRGHADIYFSRSNNGGERFSRNRRLNDDRGWAYQGNPSLGVSPEGGVFAAWSDSRNEQDDIYLTASQDGGRSFSRNVRINDDEGKSVQSHPTVGAGSGGLVIVAWEDFRNKKAEIYLARSTDSGKTFERNRKALPAPGRGQQISPSIAVGSNGWVALAWAEFVPQAVTLAPPNAAIGETTWWEDVRVDDADIFVSVSTDGGAHFGVPVKVNDDPAGNPQAFPSVAIGLEGRLFVAWEDLRNGQADIYFAEIEGRVGISPNRIVNDDTHGTAQDHPSLAVDAAGRPYLIWTDSRGNTFAERNDDDEEGNEVYFTHGK